MNDKHDEYLQEFASDQLVPTYRLNEERKFAHACCDLVIFRCHLAKDVVQRQRFSTTGDAWYTLDDVNACYPTFPWFLGCHTLRGLTVPWGSGVTPNNYDVHTDQYSTEPARYKKYEWVPFVVAFQQFYCAHAAQQAGRQLALVFPRRGVSGGMCIYEDRSERYWSRGLVHVYKFDDEGKDRRLYVRPFTWLLDEVYANGWRP